MPLFAELVGQSETVYPFRCDALISIGADLRPARHLEIAGMRNLNSPMDWMSGYSLETLLALYKTEFKTFFNLVEERPYPAHLPAPDPDSDEGRFRHVYDAENKILSTLDFPMAVTMQEYLPKFKKLMERRTKRMFQVLGSSDAAFFLGARGNPMSELRDFVAEMSAILKRPCLLLNIRYSDLEYSIKSEFPGSESAVLEYGIWDVHPDGTDVSLNKDALLGNTDAWQKVLKTVSLTDRIKAVDEDASGGGGGLFSFLGGLFGKK